MDRSAAMEEAIRQYEVELDEQMEDHREATRTAVGKMTKMYRDMES